MRSPMCAMDKSTRAAGWLIIFASPLSLCRMRYSASVLVRWTPQASGWPRLIATYWYTHTCLFKAFVCQQLLNGFEILLFKPGDFCRSVFFKPVIFKLKKVKSVNCVFCPEPQKRLSVFNVLHRRPVLF